MAQRTGDVPVSSRTRARMAQDKPKGTSSQSDTLATMVTLLQQQQQFMEHMVNQQLHEQHDLICTTPRFCQNSMTPVALRGRGTTSTYNCFPATGLYFKSKVLASVGRGSTETTRLQHGSSMFGDTHAKGGGGSSDKHGYMAFLILAK